MPTLTTEKFNRAKATIIGMEQERLPWWRLWREVGDYYNPYRYTWLQTDKERRIRNARNPFILDATGTTAAKILASGMMNGITSPSRPWFRLRIAGFEDNLNHAARVWLDEVVRRMLLVMAESNFYNAMAVVYLDLVIFGVNATIIYEDFESVFRCYNSPLGEFYLGQSDRQLVDRFAREFCYKVHQVVSQFGIENVSEVVKSHWEREGGSRFHDIKIKHLIEPNTESGYDVPESFAYRELYWEAGSNEGKLLSAKGFNEFPVVAPRWGPAGNDVYSPSPAIEALGDVIQLQHETKNKAQAIDKMHKPPMLADIRLQHKPLALMPNGVTYVAGLNTGTVGAKPAFEVNPPVAEMTLDLRDIRIRIQEIFHNPLFNMISQLDTVRTATEIDARKEEKLVLLGPVLERFENEALDPAVNRIFAIMGRAGLLPEAPPELEEQDIEIQYVSILSSAQAAVGVIPTERWLELIGGVSAIYPKAINLPNWDEMLRDYGKDLGVKAKHINPSAETAELNEAADELNAAREAAVEGQALVEGAKTLSETDVGGGANALQQIVSG